MAYKDRYGRTTIINEKLDKLSVSIDSGTFRANEPETAAVFLYTPDIENTMEHYHIEMKEEEARVLYEWLGEYLSDKDKYGKFKRDLERK